MNMKSYVDNNGNSKVNSSFVVVIIKAFEEENVGGAELLCIKKLCVFVLV